MKYFKICLLEWLSQLFLHVHTFWKTVTWYTPKKIQQGGEVK